MSEFLKSTFKDDNIVCEKLSNIGRLVLKLHSILHYKIPPIIPQGGHRMPLLSDTFFVNHTHKLPKETYKPPDRKTVNIHTIHQNIQSLRGKHLQFEVWLETLHISSDILFLRKHGYVKRNTVH